LEDTPNRFIRNPAIGLFAMGASNHPTTQVESLSDDEKMNHLLSDLIELDNVVDIPHRWVNNALVVTGSGWLHPEEMQVMIDYGAIATNNDYSRNAYKVTIQ